ncbi:hypothetical protein HDV57DRAFT_97160 [Trichoderma longibrachiatum]|uniref:Uncharacterized protein n=1 Tax=Trichoderma longibrachiatum ATCC 18648 TaxID=983965 RepID=A0A2T4BT01_TRILO|nr:hypothetical protein M440DRAFT_1087732 [Trichoderma longibrachiatum ATCC 18648]
MYKRFRKRDSVETDNTYASIYRPDPTLSSRIGPWQASWWTSSRQAENRKTGLLSFLPLHFQWHAASSWVDRNMKPWFRCPLVATRNSIHTYTEKGGAVYRACQSERLSCWWPTTLSDPAAVIQQLLRSEHCQTPMASISKMQFNQLFIGSP